MRRSMRCGRGSPTPLLTQRDLPKPALAAAFADDEAASLFATMGFWQGIDVPGRTLSLVTIDRLPFPRPDDPLLQAKRELAKADAFQAVDLPRAATLLAQGAGRLIRSTVDRGVVAVLDPRLANSRSYRWDVVRALPPMRRTRDRQVAEEFLRSLHATDAPPIAVAAPHSRRNSRPTREAPASRTHRCGRTPVLDAIAAPPGRPLRREPTAVAAPPFSTQ